MAFNVYVGWDSREAICSDVASYSITKRTNSPVNIKYLKHRELRKDGYFSRTWITIGNTGDWIDAVDGRPFSTEFSHTRFLVPSLMKYQGWALFMDADMIFQTDIKKLFDLCDPQYAAMVVKHTHIPKDELKMDGREQTKYHRKNWSSFILWNCEHPANAILTPEKVSCMHGKDLHKFSWLSDNQIGSLPFTYNYISGVSPPAIGMTPAVIHYTDGGPWFDSCKDVPFAGTWIDEYEDYQANGGYISNVPSVAFERERK